MSFHENRIGSNLNEVHNEYLSGKRVFDKYDIEDSWDLFDGLNLNEIQFSRCIIEVCFSNCSLRNSRFEYCSLKLIRFINCDLTHARFNECSVESIEFVNSKLEGVKFGVNYAYGATIEGNSFFKNVSINNIFEG